MTRIAAGALLLLAMAACSDSNEAEDSIAGSYAATSLIVTDAGTPTNALAAGASLHLILSDDGTTSGAIHIPAALSDSGEDEDETLDGTWTLTSKGTQVDFDFTEQSDFVFEDSPWTIGDSKLTFSWSGGENDAIQATLTRD